MWRYLAGAASALMLVTAGFFLWSGLARRGVPLPAVPAPLAAQPQGLASLAAAAAEPEAPQATEKTKEQKRFDRYDRDKNGKIDRDEYLYARHRNFMKLDTNGDGKLSFEEYAVKGVAKFNAADADRSGTLNATEFATTRVQRKPRKVNCPPAARPAPAEEGEQEN